MFRHGFSSFSLLSSHSYSHLFFSFLFSVSVFFFFSPQSVTASAHHVSLKKPLPSSKASKSKKTMGVSASGNKLSKRAAAALDFSNAAESEGGENAQLEEARRTFLPDAGAADESSSDEESEEESERSGGAETGWSSSFKTMLSTLTGSRVIAAADVEEPLAALRGELEAANVAADIAASICDSVKTALVGRTIQG